MTRECHVRFCEGLAGRFRWSTRLAVLWFCCAKVIHKTATYKLPLSTALSNIRVMPREKSKEEKAAGKLISAIQKEWHEEVGEKAGEETEELIGKAHDILQARNANKMRAVL